MALGSRFQSPVLISLEIHLLLISGLILLFWLHSERSNHLTVDLQVYENPQVNPTSIQVPPKPIETPKLKAREVFGRSREALTSNSSVPGVEVKEGNTLTKDPDNLKLQKEDLTSLPIPADDYLVSKMPKLKKEFRIPYPAEAKKNNIEGPVVIDLLIDKEGKVRQSVLIKGPGYGLNEAALEAVQHFEFEPATTSDGPVAVKIRYTYRFVLEAR